MVYAIVVTSENKKYYADALKEMFRQRYLIFVENLGWDLPLADHNEKVETDQFDNEDAVYLLLMDNNNLVGGLRFIPTEKPHLFSEIFPHLIEGNLQRSDAVWEGSRLYTLGKSKENNAEALLIAAALETALLCGKNEIVVATNLNALPILLNSCIGTMPLGVPKEVGNELVMAVSIQITPLGLKVYCIRNNISQSVLQTITPNTRIA